MLFIERNPPREYQVGFDTKRTIRDCGTLRLDPDEQVTFATDQGGEYDVTRKSWGFYMGPSLNARLASFNLRPVLVKNRVARFFALLVEKGFESEFNRYVAEEQLQIICWLDTTESLKRMEGSLKA